MQISVRSSTEVKYRSTRIEINLSTDPVREKKKKKEWTIDLIGSDIIEIRMRYIKFFPDVETRRGEINQSRVQCVNREL